MVSDQIAVLESLRAQGPAVRTAVDAEWPGVADPDTLRAQVAGWLSGYANAGTRRTYAYALGLPIAWADPAALPTGDARSAPPPAARGPLHDLAWFRWCARRGMDPRVARTGHVTAWLHALDAAGAGKRTRRRMLSTVAALYAHLAETGVVPANPAAINRSRMGLGSDSRDASPTITLTAGQVAALLTAAARPTVRGVLAQVHARRAVAFVALLTLGLRISEVTGLDREDVYVTGGEEVLRVRGKGGVIREVYLTPHVQDALAAYLAERDRVSGSSAPAPRGRTTAGGSPLLATRTGGRCSRTDLAAQLRRIALAGGPELDAVARRVHPHALRHAYVTIALAAGAPIQHVQADVGHASIATTQYYDRARRTRDTTAADVVARALAGDA